MKIDFTKMHGIGNDYVYIQTFDQKIEDFSSLAIKLSDRHTGIGGDGVIYVCPSEVADARMAMYNLDGSEGAMCGNGVRCVGKFLYDHNMVDTSREEITVETKSGIKTLKVFKDESGEVVELLVDMGKAELIASNIPVVADTEKVINSPLEIEGEVWNITCVSMGNPHCVTFVPDVEELPLSVIGPKFENNSIFPDRVNTEFIRVIDEKTLRMRVWERGSGETNACGTGACAAVVAACENGHCKKGEQIEVILNGGSLFITYTDETVMMRGGATKVFTGQVEV